MRRAAEAERKSLPTSSRAARPAAGGGGRRFLRLRGGADRRRGHDKAAARLATARAGLARAALREHRPRARARDGDRAARPRRPSPRRGRRDASAWSPKSRRAAVRVALLGDERPRTRASTRRRRHRRPPRRPPRAGGRRGGGHDPRPGRLGVAQVTAERAGVGADREHAGASLSELREVDADVCGPTPTPVWSSCRRRSPATAGTSSRSARRWRNIPGRSPCRRARQWPVLEALRRPGFAGPTARAPACGPRCARVLPAREPLADEVKIGADGGLRAVLAEVVVVADLRRCRTRSPGSRSCATGRTTGPQPGNSAWLPAYRQRSWSSGVRGSRRSTRGSMPSGLARRARTLPRPARGRAPSHWRPFAPEATVALEAAATALDEARRRAASAAVERRGADERAQRLDEALAAARSEAASLDAELAALAQRVVACERETAAAQGAVRVSEAAGATAEAAHLETLGALHASAYRPRRTARSRSTRGRRTCSRRTTRSKASAGACTTSRAGYAACLGRARLAPTW